MVACGVACGGGEVAATGVDVFIGGGCCEVFTPPDEDDGQRACTPLLSKKRPINVLVEVETPRHC